MGFEFIGPLVMALATGAVMVLKALFGTDRPQETTVEHAKREVEVDGGKSDADRLADLGL